MILVCRRGKFWVKYCWQLRHGVGDLDRNVEKMCERPVELANVMDLGSI